MRPIVVLTLTLGCLTCGCSSFRTTPVDRCENDTLIVNPEHPMHGIPVSLKVPTHIELKVIETTYWEKQTPPGAKPTLTALTTCRPTRTVEHEICYTEKIFLVDPVRPGAGTQDYGFTFASNEDGNEADAGKGYLKKVEYKIDDQTIKESANLLSSALGFISALPTAANPANPNKGTLIATDRTVAYGRFDLNSCSFEEDVTNFFDCHVNHVDRSNCRCPQVCHSSYCN